MKSKKLRTNNNLQNEFGLTDFILILGVGINILSLFVNNKNNDQLERINQNLTEINKNEVLENINRLANGGSK